MLINDKTNDIFMKNRDKKRLFKYFLVGGIILCFIFVFKNLANFIPGQSSLVSKSNVILMTQDNNDTSEKTNEKNQKNYKSIFQDDVPEHDKWVVITSINPVTEQMRKLISDENWRMVVVADTKTPSAWELKNTIYLSVEKQKEFGGYFSDKIPFKSYCRKNVGYLYAIKHGAKFILDVDDDNEIAINSFHFQDQMTTMTPLTNSSFYNPYSHFGQSTLWPRGYPLEHIGEKSPRYYKTMTGPSPSIQQAIVDGDPDMDAIFRLTRKNWAKMLDIKFDRTAPVVTLRKNTFSPCNAQATLWRYEAFWGMFFYGSVTWREVDIFRCYWAQRLLWFTKTRLAFFPPAAIQVRNPHNYLLDYMDERRLYEMTSQFVKALQSFSCSTDFEQCIRDSGDYLVKASFWQDVDVEWLNAWLDDLKSIGYDFPDFVDEVEHLSDSVVFFPREQHTSFNHVPDLESVSSLTPFHRTQQTIEKICGENFIVKWKQSKSDNTSLLIIGLFGKLDTALIYDAIYRPKFSNIIYCTTLKPIDNYGISFYQVSRIDPLTCIKHVFELGYSIENIIYASSNILFNVNYLKNISVKQVLLQNATDCTINKEFSDRKAGLDFFSIPIKLISSANLAHCVDDSCVMTYLGNFYCSNEYPKFNIVGNDFIDEFKGNDKSKYCQRFSKIV